MEKIKPAVHTLSPSLQTEDLYEETRISGRVSQVSSNMCDGHTDHPRFPL